jgi:zinc transporter ZupT
MLFLFGTGALFGICVFDLLPDIFEMGGRSGLAMSIAVGVAYSLVHLFHLRKHQSQNDSSRNRSQDKAACEESHCENHNRQHAHSLPIFFVSIVSHCFASGILLSVSRELSEKLAGAVFLALLGHKGYECIVFISLLISHRLSRLGTIAAIAVYCLALPAGVLTAVLLNGHWTQNLAVYVSSIAVGSLLGCLVFDFMLPSFETIKRERLRVGWVLLGLALTRVVMLVL